MTLEGHGAAGRKAVHEVHAESAVQHQSIISAMIGTVPESVPSCRSDDPGRSEVPSAVRYPTFLVMDLFKRVAGNRKRRLWNYFTATCSARQRIELS